MNKNKLPANIKAVLDDAEPSDNIIRQLQSRRVQMLDQVTAKGNWWPRSWLVPAASIMATALITTVLMMPNGQHEFAEMAELSEEELEIMSTMDIEDIEELEFYVWLGWQEGRAG